MSYSGGNIGSFRSGTDDLQSSQYSVGSSNIGGGGFSKDINLEFFQMLWLSYKMNNQDLEEVLELDSQEMYKKCTEEDKVTFFQFNEWISKEFNKIKFRKFYALNKKKLQRNKKLMTKLEAMDGVQLIRGISVVNDHM